jgi:hypothetical protein
MSALFYRAACPVYQVTPVRSRRSLAPPDRGGAGPCFAGAGKRAQNHARIWIFSKVIFDRMGGALRTVLHRHIVPIYHRPVVSRAARLLAMALSLEEDYCERNGWNSY